MFKDTHGRTYRLINTDKQHMLVEMGQANKALILIKYYHNSIQPPLWSLISSFLHVISMTTLTTAEAEGLSKQHNRGGLASTLLCFPEDIKSVCGLQDPPQREEPIMAFIPDAYKVHVFVYTDFLAELIMTPTTEKQLDEKLHPVAMHTKYIQYLFINALLRKPQT